MNMWYHCPQGSILRTTNSKLAVGLTALKLEGAHGWLVIVKSRTVRLHPASLRPEFPLGLRVSAVLVDIWASFKRVARYWPKVQLFADSLIAPPTKLAQQCLKRHIHKSANPFLGNHALCVGRALCVVV